MSLDPYSFKTKLAAGARPPALPANISFQFAVRSLRAMLAAAPPGLMGLRDRAALLLGFAAALRRSELVAIDVADLHFTRRGVAVTIRRSKTDPQGEGAVIGVPCGTGNGSCPVRALRRWLATAGITRGAVFRGVSRHGHVLGRLSDKGSSSTAPRAAAGLPDPTNDETVTLALRRMHRARGRRPHQATGLTRNFIDQMLSGTGDHVLDLRDAALVSVAYDTLCRRSETRRPADRGHCSVRPTAVARSWCVVRRPKERGSELFSAQTR